MEESLLPHYLNCMLNFSDKPYPQNMQPFTIDGYYGQYRFNGNIRERKRPGISDNWHKCDQEDSLIDIILHPEKIKLLEVNDNAEQKESDKA